MQACKKTKRTRGVVPVCYYKTTGALHNRIVLPVIWCFVLRACGKHNTRPLSSSHKRTQGSKNQNWNEIVYGLQPAMLHDLPPDRWLKRGSALKPVWRRYSKYFWQHLSERRKLIACPPQPSTEKKNGMMCLTRNQRFPAEQQRALKPTSDD